MAGQAEARSPGRTQQQQWRQDELEGASQPPAPRQLPASRLGLATPQLIFAFSSIHRCLTAPPPSGDSPGPAWAGWFLRLLVRKLLLVSIICSFALFCRIRSVQLVACGFRVLRVWWLNDNCLLSKILRHN
jgi:hypothetical protein